eukprot:2483083-Rhodomonas_salina.1
MSDTGFVCAAIGLRACYAMPGTGLRCWLSTFLRMVLQLPRRCPGYHIALRLYYDMSGTCIGAVLAFVAIMLRSHYDKSGTDISYPPITLRNLLCLDHALGMQSPVQY